jgi:hypothetical protein
LGKVTRGETAAAGLDNASVGKERWIVDMELACEADTALDQKTVATELRGQAGDATLSAATIRGRRRTPPTALSGRGR